MAVSLDSGGGGRGRARWKPKAEINVTPFVDVMLVLLIVFMVTAPLLTVGIEIDMPETEAQQLPAIEEPITVTLTAQGTVFLQETEVELGELSARLRAIAASGTDHPVAYRWDASANGQHIAQVLGDIQAAGFTRVQVITDPVEG